MTVAELHRKLCKEAERLNLAANRGASERERDRLRDQAFALSNEATCLAKAAVHLVDADASVLGERWRTWVESGVEG